MTGCPGCGHEGDGDDVLSNDQRWCPDTECPVVSFHSDREGGLPRLFDAEDRATFREAVDRWGTPAQMDMATEEAGEVIRELAKFIQDVAGDPYGGAFWESEDEQVSVRQWHDGTWSAEAIPIDRGVDRGTHEADVYYAYKGTAEHNLTRLDAFELAAAYMAGEADLTQPTTMALINQRQTPGQADLGRWSA